MRDELLKIIDGNPLRLRESYFINNHKILYDEIIDFTKKLDISFKQRIWHYINCKPDYVMCKICGGEVSFNRNWLLGYKSYCSAKCSQKSEETKQKRKNTVIEKYGVDNISKLETTKKKQELTNLEKYGHKSSFQNSDVRDKWVDSIRSKWGVDHYSKTDIFKDNYKSYFLDNYGVDHPSKMNSVQDKIKESNLERFGVDHITKTKGFWVNYREKSIEKFGVDHPLKSDIVKNKIKDSSNNKWGVDNYFMTHEFKQRFKDYFLDKYGVDHYTKTEEYKEYLKSNRYREIVLKNRISFYNRKGFNFISDSERNGFVTLTKLEGCQHLFDVHPTTLQRRMDANIETCTICNPINSSKSGQENNIVNFLKELDQNYIHSDRRLISPYEIDFLLPDHKIAIEYNGLYWHSELNRDKYYHYDKMNKCLELGYQILNIWEDDWLYKLDIVKSVIKNRLNLIENKIYARKCKSVKLTNRKMVNDFFESNHLQGKTNWTDAVGLYYDDLLVSCMLFHNTRGRIELVRFCNIINVSVIGSASKLFKFYVSNNSVSEIISFSDSSIFSGDIYISLGFEFAGETPVNYWWCVNGIRRHRFTFNKKKLVSMGNDPSKSEVDIMHELGNYRIWGCGMRRWIWKR